MKNILFIDDDYNRLSSHIEMLKIQGYDVKGINSAKEALEELRMKKDKYDVIILDLMMPVDEFGVEETKNGRETGLVLLGKLREISKDIPVIVLTVLRDPSVMEKARKLGVNEYLLKPQFPSKLIKVIEKFGREKRT
jgi:CheY-like chemotaxis protein